MCLCSGIHLRRLFFALLLLQCDGTQQEWFMAPGGSNFSPGTAGLGRTTPMLGFNTWNNFACKGISGKVLMDTADSFVALGLDKLGYNFINSDDCWMLKKRSNNGKGPMQPNPTKFPKGVKFVADYIHAKGLSMGLYTTRANRSCDGYAGLYRVAVCYARILPLLQKKLRRFLPA